MRAWQPLLVFKLLGPMSALIEVEAACQDDLSGRIPTAMPRFRVGDRVRVKDSTAELASRTGAIIDISYFREDPNPREDPRVYVLKLDDGSVRRFTGDEIEPE